MQRCSDCQADHTDGLTGRGCCGHWEVPLPADAPVVVPTVEALQGLRSCVQANSAGKGFLNGWGATDTAPPGSASVTAAIQKTNEQLAAMGVPGVAANTGLGSVTGTASNSDDPCGSPVPWTGILCSGNRVTQVYAPNSLLLLQRQPDLSMHVRSHGGRCVPAHCTSPWVETFAWSARQPTYTMFMLPTSLIQELMLLHSPAETHGLVSTCRMVPA